MVKKRWIWVPPKPKKPTVPKYIEKEVKKTGDAFIDAFLKPTFIKPPPKNSDLNHISGIYSRWRRNCFYFIAEYRCLSQKAVSKTFEHGFARLEYLANGKFALSYMRYTGQWWEIFRDLSLNECLKKIKNMQHFYPA